MPTTWPSSADPPRGRRVRLGPTALDEERGANVDGGERIEQPVGIAVVGRSVGMLGVEREGDPERHYFSTPVMTMPRMKIRWNAMKRSTGTINVIIVPAWM